jgi:hypothetical protein
VSLSFASWTVVIRTGDLRSRSTSGQPSEGPSSRSAATAWASRVAEPRSSLISAVNHAAYSSVRDYRSRIRPALQSAHIRPVASGGKNRLDNGLLLRSDVHAMFDGGYLGVDPAYRLRVSPRLRDEFGNGEQFYAQAGQLIALPEHRIDRRSASSSNGTSTRCSRHLDRRALAEGRGRSTADGPPAPGGTGCALALSARAASSPSSSGGAHMVAQCSSDWS